MNKVILIGRLTKDVDVRSGENGMVARYTLAVDREYKKDGEATADFLNCVAFGKAAEFADRYLRKGMKIAVEGRIRTGSYTNKEGQKVYTTDIVVDRHEFCERKGAENDGYDISAAPAAKTEAKPINVPDELDAELPFD